MWEEVLTVEQVIDCRGGKCVDITLTENKKIFRGLRSNNAFDDIEYELFRNELLPSF